MQPQQIDLQELESYLTGHWLTDLANFSAYLAHHIPDLNWVGFYLSDGKTLRLGPFYGAPACTQISFGRGVCGRAFAENKVLIVDDVDAFPDHIRCDSRSRSELVIPLILSGQILGVLDLDSPSRSRFTLREREILEAALKLLTSKIESSSIAKFGVLNDGPSSN